MCVLKTADLGTQVLLVVNSNPIFLRSTRAADHSIDMLGAVT